MSDLDDDDDLDWDEWMALTDEQREAAIDLEVARTAACYNALPLSGKIAARRRWSLDNCKSARRLIALPHCPEIIKEDSRERLKGAQKRLLAIRIWRATGTYPGEA